ncbi:hypothetical protein GCM10023156_52880 [Novipirellula rosea]|uniref:Uncharacterized protein n=1 Tax=Novipirellula rosea TaxID=1031540 RepID=A0ABP8NG07_9BACT
MQKVTGMSGTQQRMAGLFIEVAHGSLSHWAWNCHQWLDERGKKVVEVCCQLFSKIDRIGPTGH